MQGRSGSVTTISLPRVFHRNERIGAEGEPERVAERIERRERTDVVAHRAPSSLEPGALVTDETLVNAWGLAFNPMGVAWVAATETGWTGVYDAGGRLIRESTSAGSRAYEYDAAGQLLAVTDADGTRTDVEAVAYELVVRFSPHHSREPQRPA